MKVASTWWRLLGIAVLLVSMTGCAVNRESATVDPSTNLKAIRTVHVVQLTEDDNKVYQDIADNLRARGYTVTSSEKKVENVDATVTYFDKWQWDITMYLLQLTVVIRDPKTDFPLATGESLHTSLTRKAQKDMVTEVLDNIFKKRSAS